MRSNAYRREATIIVEQNQNVALNTTMCIVQNFGPMGFLIHEENGNQKHKVFIGERHTCTCKLYSKERDLCKHICWILLKKFKLNKHDPISWQNGLSDRELSKLLEKSLESNVVATIPEKKLELEDISEVGITSMTRVCQRPIEQADICPICQDEFLSSHRSPVTYCRNGCGNNVHIKCMKIWKDHRTKEQNIVKLDCISCPICRGNFAKLGDLNHEILLCENRFNKTAKALSDEELIVGLITRRNNMEVHKDICYLCACSPITGQIYCSNDAGNFSKGNKVDKVLCGNCFNKCIRLHTEEKPETAVEALIRPLSRRELSKIPKWLIKADIRSSIQSGRCEGGHASGLLAPGQQCRICLMHFQEGEEVRSLLNCNHIFHSNCVDPWLLHL
ncbi:unnamed protein product [Rodentolepis nana]|uniref:E3 ubiquitin-protein ligase ZSWIM2 n=1 Tax=Rodentolepis nana TaxID=102285 RepID=A0A0R3TRS1_RODNA|nr:unnamed protein product [Rodentolepis nana]